MNTPEDTSRPLPMWDWVEYPTTEHTALEPIIKWSGSKRSVLDDLRQHIPAHQHYIEPFVGGGSMLTLRGCSNRVAGDIIPELIGIWKLVQTDPVLVKRTYEQLWTHYRDSGVGFYYHTRNQFNENRDPLLFLFLTRTAYNGLIRFNGEGAFNSPCHFNRPGIHPKTFNGVVNDWNHLIQGVHFIEADYRTTLLEAQRDTFVFLDPPYVGQTALYLSQPFDFSGLCSELERLNQIGAKWMLTLNHNAAALDVIPKGLYQDTFHTSPGNSSFRRLKNQRNAYVTDTVFVNYPIGEKENHV